MFARALLLLLLVLNVGVAAWWMLRPDAPPATPAPAPVAPPLHLVGEIATAASRPASASSLHATSPAMPMAAGTARCLRLGPFASDAALAHAQSVLQPQAVRMVVATVPTSTTRGWRVWLPPLADRAAAQAMATRISSAGFSDYYVVPAGAEANSIALGRYGNADAAQRRQAQLQAAGFAAKAEPLGGATRWIDIATTAATGDAALRTATGAGQAHALDCAAVH